MKQALIVIDVQESFRRRPYFRDEELPRFLRNLQSLIDRCAARGIAEILERTELVLDGRFARIVSTAQALA